MKTPTWSPRWPACLGGVVATFSRGIYRKPNLQTLLGASALRLRPSDWQATEVSCVVGWGNKPNTDEAVAYARRHGLTYLRLEDGFVRSVGLGVHGAPGYSLVCDDLGVYYDSTCESRLERILNGLSEDGSSLQDPALLQRAQACMERILSGQLSKYNNSPVNPPSLPLNDTQKRVLIVDQTAGDMSLKLGQVTDATFADMLAAACTEHPDAQILIKTHPDVAAGKKRSALWRSKATAHPQIRLLTENCNPIALLQQVDHVYVATSQMGFEALLCGKPVTCFGAPFYAGWGLTDDRVAIPRRQARRTLPQVFAATYLLYSRYINPATGQRGELEDVLAHMTLQREMFARNANAHECQGFSSWKHDFIRAYLQSPSAQTRFRRKFKATAAETRVVRWGTKDKLNAQAAGKPVDTASTQMLRMEDGFLRSAGLGSDLTVPASLVVDRQGIYYDPTQPSDLETILQHTEFDADELARARALRKLVIEARLSKYNLGSQGPIHVRARTSQRVILVPGQVEDDASIRLGCLDVRTNLELVQAVREARPNDYIIYKPHPDVLTGNRRGRVHQEAAKAYCDEIITDVHVHHCLAAADEVHTMTSLVGFEGLLRERAVFTYGLPFYAGWGLTTDRHRIARRTRTLCLDTLVAGTLLRYPRYLHPETLEFTTPEAVVHYLRHAGPARNGLRKPLVLRQLGRLSRAVWGVASAR